MAERKLDILDQKVVYEGTSDRGDYKIYEVIATNENGEPVSDLRSFSELPRGPGVYEIKRFEKNGRVSYTVKKPGGGGGGGERMHARLDELAGKLKDIERQLMRLEPIEQGIDALNERIRGLAAERRDARPFADGPGKEGF